MGSMRGRPLGSSQERGQPRRREATAGGQRQGNALFPTPQVHRRVPESVISTPPPLHALLHCHADKSQEQRVARIFPRPCGPRSWALKQCSPQLPLQKPRSSLGPEVEGARESKWAGVPSSASSFRSWRAGWERCAAPRCAPRPACRLPLAQLGHVPGLRVEGYEALTLRCFRFFSRLCFPSQGGG